VARWTNFIFGKPQPHKNMKKTIVIIGAAFVAAVIHAQFAMVTNYTPVITRTVTSVVGQPSETVTYETNLVPRSVRPAPIYLAAADFDRGLSAARANGIGSAVFISSTNTANFSFIWHEATNAAVGYYFFTVNHYPPPFSLNNEMQPLTQGIPLDEATGNAYITLFIGMGYTNTVPSGVHLNAYGNHLLTGTNTGKFLVNVTMLPPQITRTNSVSH